MGDGYIHKLKAELKEPMLKVGNGVVCSSWWQALGQRSSAHHGRAR